MATTTVGLLSLPDELLDLITRLVHEGSVYESRVTLLFVCRRIGRLAQKHLYRSPTSTVRDIFDKERLDLFNQALRSRPKLREYVQQITLAPVCKRKRTSKREAAFLDTQGVAELGSLLLRLPNVTDVTLACFSCEAVDELLFTIACMPRASRITMDASYAVADWTEGLWSRLTDMSALRHLTICFTGNHFRLPSASSAFPGLEELRTLELPSSFIADDADATSLAAFSPKLEKLVVNSRHRDYFRENADDENDLEGDAELRYPFLRSIPTSLSHLQINGPADLERDRALLDIPGLRQLTLGWGSKLAEVVPILAQAKIEHIALETGAIAEDADIAALLEGPRRLLSLRRLSLNHVDLGTLPMVSRVQELRAKLECRTSAECAGDLTKSGALRALGDLSSVWPRGCSGVGIECAFELAETVGVVLDGNAVDCLEWDRLVVVEFERMLVDRIARAHALVVECLGADHAAVVVRQRHPDLVSRIEGRGGGDSGGDDGTSSGTVT